MLETAHTLLIEASVDRVWDYVRDMRRWAALLPGCKECVMEDADNSRWILKVGAGGLVRTVNALVHVDKWDGPGRVDFSFKLEGDPVEGGGSYIAAENGPAQSEVTLQVRILGSGPLAPMWEAMSRPLLPRIAKSFATQLKDEIEKSAAPAAGEPAPRSEADSSKGLASKLRNLLSTRRDD
jgi:carbon monoxide dehydrogenase subunit G